MKYIIDKKKIKKVLDCLSRKASVYVPAELDGITRFVTWDGEVVPVWDRNTLIPPKEIVFPQTEKMYAYSSKGMDVELKEAEKSPDKMVIFGIRPCDVRAINLLDKVFLDGEFCDTYYQNGRDNIIILSLGCTQAEQTCFCESMGVNPRESDGADIVMHDFGENFLFHAKNEKGEMLLAEFEEWEQTDEKEIEEGELCELKVDMEGIPQKLNKMFEHPIWDEFYRKCLSCGICTFLCPTCHCFDMQNENMGRKGFKFRCWDSCIFEEFTLMAAGYNPRPTKKERIRNRFLHKLCYFPEKYQELGCVGCGRCLQECPVNMDITFFIRRVKEVKTGAR